MKLVGRQVQVLENATETEIDSIYVNQLGYCTEDVVNEENDPVLYWVSFNDLPPELFTSDELQIVG